MIPLRAAWHRLLWWWHSTHAFEDRAVIAALHLAEYRRIMKEWK